MRMLRAPNGLGAAGMFSGRSGRLLVWVLGVAGLSLGPLASVGLTQGDTTRAEAQEESAEAQEEAAEAQEESAEAPNPQVAITVTLYDDDGRATKLGTVTIELYADLAPLHVANFLKLAQEEFYEGTTIHRIVPAFVIQGGDPISKTDWTSPRVGTGGPGYTIPAELGGKNVRGAVAAARQPDEVNPKRESSGSQFYICLADLPALDRGGYSVFGQVVSGMDVVDKIARVKNSSQHGNRALQRVQMTEVKILEP